MNELDGKLARWKLRLQDFGLEVKYPLQIMNKALSHLDYRTKASTPVDDVVPTMKFRQPLCYPRVMLSATTKMSSPWVKTLPTSTHWVSRRRSRRTRSWRPSAPTSSSVVFCRLLTHRRHRTDWTTPVSYVENQS